MGRFSKLETGTGGPPKGDLRVVDAIPAAAEVQAAAPEVFGVVEFIAKGDAALFGGDETGALRWYSRTLEPDEAAMPAWAAHIRLLILRGKRGQADIWITRGLSIFPTSAPLMALRAENLGRQGRLKQALQTSDMLLATRDGLAPESAEQVWLSRGHLLLMADNPNCDACFEQALTHAPGEAWKTLFWIGLICDSEGRWSRSVFYYKRALEQRPGLACAWFRLARAHTRLGQLGGAASALAEAENHCGDNEGLRAQIHRTKPGTLLDILKGLFTRG